MADGLFTVALGSLQKVGASKVKVTILKRTTIDHPIGANENDIPPASMGSEIGHNHGLCNSLHGTDLPRKGSIFQFLEVDRRYQCGKESSKVGDLENPHPYKLNLEFIFLTFHHILASETWQIPEISGGAG